MRHPSIAKNAAAEARRQKEEHAKHLAVARARVDARARVYLATHSPEQATERRKASHRVDVPVGSPVQSASRPTMKSASSSESLTSGRSSPRSQSFFGGGSPKHKTSISSSSAGPNSPKTRHENTIPHALDELRTRARSRSAPHARRFGSTMDWSGLAQWPLPG